MTESDWTTALSNKDAKYPSFEELLISMFSTTIQEVQRYKECSNIALGTIDRMTSSSGPTECTSLLLDNATSAYYGYQNGLRGLHKTLRNAVLATAKLENLLENGATAQLLSLSQVPNSLSSSLTADSATVGPKKVLDLTLESTGFINITAVMASNWLQCLLLMQRKVVCCGFQECDKTSTMTHSLLEAMVSALTKEYSHTAASLLPPVVSIDETEENVEYCYDENNKLEKRQVRDEKSERALLIAHTVDFLKDTGNKATSFTVAHILSQACCRCTRVLRIVKPLCVRLDSSGCQHPHILQRKEKREALALITGKLILRLGRLYAMYLCDIPGALTLLRELVPSSDEKCIDDNSYCDSSNMKSNEKSHGEYYPFINDNEGLRTVQRDISDFQRMHENASRSALKGLKGRLLI